MCFTSFILHFCTGHRWWLLWFVQSETFAGEKQSKPGGKQPETCQDRAEEVRIKQPIHSPKLLPPYPHLSVPTFQIISVTDYQKFPMEAPTLAEMGDLCHSRSSSPEGETVCAALARYENTLRDAIREIHVDVSAFKLGIERRLEETANLSGPLGRAVAQLQQENRQLRSQLETLTRQVELLSGLTCDRGTLLNNNHNHSQNHKNHLNDIQENHEDIKEVVYGRGQAHTHTHSQAQLQIQTLGNQAQTYSSLSNQSSPASPPATFLSSPNSSSPPAGSRVSSSVSGSVTSSSPSAARFSSRATFAVSSKTNVSTECL